MCVICSLGDMLQALVANALLSSSLAPGNVAVEVVHGTGTPLGDPIEVSALSGALAAGRAPVPPVLASVKACLPPADALPLCRNMHLRPESVGAPAPHVQPLQACTTSGTCGEIGPRVRRAALQACCRTVL